MEEDNYMSKFHIQEYECGQKTNLYQMDNWYDCVNLITTKRKSNAFLALFRDFFYLDSYPLGTF